MKLSQHDKATEQNKQKHTKNDFYRLHKSMSKRNMGNIFLYVI